MSDVKSIPAFKYVFFVKYVSVFKYGFVVTNPLSVSKCLLF